MLPLPLRKVKSMERLFKMLLLPNEMIFQGHPLMVLVRSLLLKFLEKREEEKEEKEKEKEKEKEEK